MTHGIRLWGSRHNLKYWTRQPYLGFGVDAHSMLMADDQLAGKRVQAVRFATPDSLEAYQQLSAVGCQLAVEEDRIAARGQQLKSSRTLIDKQSALEEEFFLGLRLNHGVSISALKQEFGDEAINSYQAIVDELSADGLLLIVGERLHLTPKGRLLSNEVFARFLREEPELRKSL